MATRSGASSVRGTRRRGVAAFMAMMDELEPRFEPHPIIFEFLDIIQSGRAAPGVPRFLHRAIARASVSLLPAHIRGKLQLARATISRASTAPHFASQAGSPTATSTARRRIVRRASGSACRMTSCSSHPPSSSDFSSWLGAAVEAGPAHGAPGRRAAMLAIPQDADAVDEDVAHPDRILVRLLEGRPVADRRRIEDHDIGIIAGLAARRDP